MIAPYSRIQHRYACHVSCMLIVHSLVEFEYHFCFSLQICVLHLATSIDHYVIPSNHCYLVSHIRFDEA